MSDAVLVVRPAAVSHRRMVLVSLAIALLALSAIGVGMGKRRFDPPPIAASRAAEGPDWIEAPQASRLFTLDAPLLRGLVSAYAVRRQILGGAREDLLVFGTPGFEAPAVRLRLRQGPGTDVSSLPPPLFAAMAREAAEGGFALERAGLAGRMTTRFGAFETVDLTLGDGRGTHVPCTGLRLVVDTPALTVAGVACGALGQPIERAALACLVDRLELAPGAGDKTLTDVFASGRLVPICGNGAAKRDGLADRPDDKPATPVRTSRRH